MALKPEWHLSETYAYTHSFTRMDWAWEFVRRHPDLYKWSNALSGIETEIVGPTFQKITAKEVCPEIGHFGLLFF